MAPFDTIGLASRRAALKGAAAATVASAFGFPAIVRAQEPIRLGVLQPLSGGLEVLGRQGVQGVQLAVEEANEAGGVLDGRMIELVIADDRTDPKTAVERTTELIQRDQVIAICGPVTSANRDAIQPTVERYQTPLLYATDYEGGVCSRYITCYSALPEHWVEPFIPFLQENYGDSYYLFGSDYIWPQKMNEAIRRVVGEVGGEVVGEEYTPFGVKDFTSTVRKITGSGAKVLVITVVGADAITFVKQFVAAGGKADTTIAFLGYSENYLSGFTTEESEGILCPANFIETLDRPEARAFVAKVRDRFGADAVVSNTVDAHYMLTRFFIEGIKRAGTVDKEAITDAMVDQTLMSGNGEVYLRPQDRHVDLNVLIAETTGGQLVLKQDIGPVEAPSQCPA
jgi:branched-chain amino acid transport system substrate-binding protein/urea transport system substrate-binding protein